MEGVLLYKLRTKHACSKVNLSGTIRCAYSKQKRKKNRHSMNTN